MNITTPIKTLKQAEEIIGGLSNTEKMPCPSYSISAKRCVTGSKLAEVAGSVCSDCYALKGNYVRYAKTIGKAHERRYESLTNPQWVDAMSFIVSTKRLTHFRWHDSGDIQNLQHLINIVSIAERCPDTLFWLPTKEKALVHEYERSIGAIPANLVVRISSAMIDGEPLKEAKHTSTVHTSKPMGHECKAYENAGKCGDCRACWDVSIKNVSYKQH
jgi:hypothetical protein